MNDKRKKTYAVVVAVGLLALLADRLFFAEPVPASAGTAASEPRPGRTGRRAAADPDVPGSSPRAVVTTASFPRNLPQTLAEAPLRDAFSLTPAVVEALGGAGANAEATASDADPQEAEPPVMTAARFAREHRLSVVLAGDGVSMAVVNDEWMRVGQSLDECTLVEISGRSATFECRDGLARLSVEIEEPGASP